MCLEPGLSDFGGRHLLEGLLDSSALHPHGALHHRGVGRKALLSPFSLFLAPGPLAVFLAHIPSLNQA